MPIIIIRIQYQNSFEFELVLKSNQNLWKMKTFWFLKKSFECLTHLKWSSHKRLEILPSSLILFYVFLQFALFSYWRSKQLNEINRANNTHEHNRLYCFERLWILFCRLIESRLHGNSIFCEKKFPPLLTLFNVTTVQLIQYSTWKQAN